MNADIFDELLTVDTSFVLTQDDASIRGEKHASQDAEENIDFNHLIQE